MNAPLKVEHLLPELDHTHLDWLEEEAIFILREAAAAFDGGRPLNVFMAGAEAVPFIKTGGLADVVDAVARGLAARGHRVMMVLPNYRTLKTHGIDFKPAGEVSVPIDGRVETAKLLTAKVDGVDVVLLDHPGYYQRSSLSSLPYDEAFPS